MFGMFTIIGGAGSVACACLPVMGELRVNSWVSLLALWYLKGKEGDRTEFATSSQPFAVLWFDVPGCAG